MLYRMQPYDMKDTRVTKYLHMCPQLLHFLYYYTEP